MPTATKSDKSLERMAKRVPFYLTPPPSFQEGFGYWLKPGGFRPCDAIVYAPISTSFIRDVSHAKGWQEVTQATGTWEAGTYRANPPTRERCKEIADELNSRKEYEMELLDDAIQDYDERAATGKREWSGNYRQKAIDHKAIRERLRDAVVEGDQLYAFFVQMHAAQAQAALDPKLQAAQQAAREAEEWTEIAQKAVENLA